MLIVIAIILGTAQYFMVRDAGSTMRANATKIIAAIDTDDNDELIIDPSAAPGCHFTVFLTPGQAYFDNSGWGNIDYEPAEWDNISKLTVDGEDLLILDTQIENDNAVIGRLRVISSTDPIEKAINNIWLISILIIPVYISIAVIGSLFIAKKALKPIDKVTFTARQIAGLDLSQRIDTPKTDDEVGRLIDAFNEMIANLESAFLRERLFTSDASHELRTPLAVIGAQSEEALHGEKTILEYQEALDRIASESKKMNKIITQLLMLTRSYDSKQAVTKEHFDIGAVIRDIISEMDGLAESYGVSIHYTGQENMMIHADHLLITQMLINLISNACKYGKPNGIATISAEVVGDYMDITVNDDGIGIAQEDLSHIFERFYRADKSRSGDGSGLGLSIVKWIVEAHLGSIEIKSELGEGTSIRISIPN